MRASQSDYSSELRKEFPNLAFMQEVDKTLRVTRVIATYAQHSRRADTPPPAPLEAGVALLKDHLASGGPDTLDEVASKQLLTAYGIAVPREELARDEEEAAAVAQRIGYPVVAKIVSAAIAHKSDIGGVRVGLKDETELRSAFRSIFAAAAALPDAPAVDGILVAEMISGGMECVLGATRDPEVGPVIVFGSGGVDLELSPDIALSAPVFTEADAFALVDRTRAGRLTRGYRGRPALDRKSLAQAIIGLSRLVQDGGDAIQSVDINPYLLREKGGIALDGLVVLRR
jgi:acyl-CoA synthetase (NDP forming)